MVRIIRQALAASFLGVLIGTMALGPLPALAQSTPATLLPNAVQQYTDDAGVPVANGQVYYYVPNSPNTKKTVWQDADKTVQQANPVQLDAAGRPQPAGQTYGDGLYRQKVVDQNGLTVWDAVTSSTGGSGGGGGGTPTVIGDGLMVGSLLPWSSPVLPQRYMWANGDAVNRADFPDLYDKLTISTSITCVAGQPVISGITDTTQIPVGAKVESTCTTPTATVISKTSNTITLNTNASLTTSVTAVFFPWGNGDGTFTFNLPDYRGRTIVGRNNMGGTPAAWLTSTYYGVDPNGLGVPGGSQSHVQTIAEMATHTHPNTLTDPGHVHSGVFVSLAGTLPTSGSGADAIQSLNNGNTNTALTGITINNQPQGSSQAFTLIQPSMATNIMIKVLPDSIVSIAGNSTGTGDVIVLQTSPTIITPTINGGTLDGVSITNSSISTGTTIDVPVMSSALDTVTGGAVGTLAMRGVSGWTGLPPGPGGTFLRANGAGNVLTYNAIAGTNLAIFDTVAQAATYSPTTAPEWIQTQFYDANYVNGSGALYRNNGTSSGDIVITLGDGVTNVGFSIWEPVLRPQMFGAIGDGITNDTAAIQTTENHAVAGQTIDFSGLTYLVAPIGTSTTPVCPTNNCYAVKTAPGVIHQNGTIKWTSTNTLYGALVAANNTTFKNMVFVGSGTVGDGSNALLQAAIYSGATSSTGSSPASNVRVTDSQFSNMTIGVAVNPDTADATPVEWVISGNQFSNIVGYPGQSEGYGVLAALSNYVTVTHNQFRTIRRHAVYYTGVLNGVINANSINGVDNIAIQLNTFSSQPANLNTVVSNNTISGFTRSIPYGYNSSVGVGAYGKSNSLEVTGNAIIGALDIGIDVFGNQGDSIATGSRALVSGNNVTMDATATVGCIQLKNFNDAVANGNKCSLSSAISGVVMTNDIALTQPMWATNNSVFSTNASAIGINTAMNNSGQAFATGNRFSGITRSQQWIDTSNNGGDVRTDMHSGTLSISSDGDYTHTAGAYGAQHAGKVKFVGSLTAARTFALSTTNIPIFITSFMLVNASSTAFSFNVTNGSGGPTLKSVPQNTWSRFEVNEASGDWVYVGSGAM